MKLRRAIKSDAHKGVIYGPPGIGKSTFLSQSPDPLFIDTDKRAGNLDVRPNVPENEPNNYEDVMNILSEFTRGKVQGVQTVVIDTADWLEAWLAASICKRHKKKGLSDFSWGQGYELLGDEWRNTLAVLDQVVAKGTHVWIAGHSQIETFKNPLGPDYDRYSMKLTRTNKVNLSAMTVEWASVVLFADYDSISVEVGGKNIGMNGEKRVVHSQRCAAFEAKSNFALPAKMPLDWGNFVALLKAGEPEDPTVIIDRIKLLSDDPEIRASLERNAKNPAKLKKLEEFLKTKQQTGENNDGN